MSKEFVYRAEYALSDRAMCKKCQRTMSKDTLRLCYMQQSRFHDGKDALWHHPRCFFQVKRNVSVDEIWHFHDLRWKDQLRVRKMAEGKKVQDSDSEEDEEPEDIPEPKSSGKRGAKPSGASAAKKSKPEDGGAGGHEAGMLAQNERVWACRDRLAALPKKALADILTANNQHVPVAGKMLDRVTDVLVFGAPTKCTVCNSDEGHIVISADAYYCIGSVSGWAKCDFKTQTPARQPTVIPEDLLKKFAFLQAYSGVNPSTRTFALCFQSPTQSVGQNTFSGQQNGKNGVSTVDGASSSNVASTSRPASVKKSEKPIPAFNPKIPLKGLKIGACGTLSVKRADMTKMITALGGQNVGKASKDTFVMISDEKSIALRPVVLEMAQVCGVHVVTVDFIAECQDEKLKTRQDLVEVVERLKINPWTTTAASLLAKMDPSKEQLIDTSALSSSELHRMNEEIKNRRLVSGGDAKAKVVVKNGSALDPDSDLDAAHHSVHRADGVALSCVLAKTNVADAKNSFYKMQVIKRDNREEYYFFRSWGRIGTVIGGNTCVETDLEDALQQFEFHFMDKTGNEWGDRMRFEKKPSKYFIMEMDYGPEEAEENAPTVTPGSKTKLEKPIQDVIRMIFDVEEMKKTMMTFEIDMRKMPLGKMSRKQILEAMAVLGEAQSSVQAGERADSPRIIGATNRFFTLIPHDFGVEAPPVLNQIKLIKDKLEMLENLLEIEVAFNILRSEKKSTTEDPLDQHYEKLKCGVEVVDKNEPAYKQICQYVENTHAATHTEYKLRVVDIFRVTRQGEGERFEKHRKLHNHKLLWHGSRTTNYAGILSQGLRIAPPEAPVTGYMFGKGVYFADMVTKSANYCFVNRTNPLGLLLLSDVALGNMHELTEAKAITRLPPDCHSVKGCGQTRPDPTEAVTLSDGLEIPLGHSKPSGVKQTSLLYNEYIVYDEAQVNLRYLLKVKFDYGAR